MKKVKGELIGGKVFGPNREEAVAIFINEKKIKREDIIQIVFNSANAGYGIFYYVDENEDNN